ncbi:MAG: CvpA family protein [Verrucomicrobiales bacterium]|nr:CvpA family protein [Verrucomicrobiales bacterium]
MLIWAGVIVIFVVLGVSSYYKGAVRSLVSLIGLFVATLVALPLGPYVKGLVPKLGLTHPVWPYIVPPVIVFAIVVLIFMGVSFLVHHKVYMHYKYATDDYTRVRWERLNRRLGLCVGILAGSVYTLLLGLGIYIFGYPAVQFTTDQSPQSQQYLRDARMQLSQSGLDRSVSALDPMPSAYYQVTDLAGLVYNNPSVLERLANYPPFLQFSEMSEFKDIVTDTAIMGALQTQAPVQNIVNDPKILGLLDNPTVMGVIEQVDPVDLFNYLKTGDSQKYDGEKILGRWQLLVSDTYIKARRQNPDMSAKEMRSIKTFITVFLPGLSLMATPEKAFHVKLDLKPRAQAMIRSVEEARRAAEAAANQGAAGFGMSADYAARYGITGGGAAAAGVPQGGWQDPNQQQAPRQVGLPDIPGVQDLNIAGKGSWSKSGSRYSVEFKDAKDRSRRGTVVVDDDILEMTVNNMTLVFLRVMRQPTER